MEIKKVKIELTELENNLLNDIYEKMHSDEILIKLTFCIPF